MPFTYAYPCRKTKPEAPDSVAYLEAAIKRLDRDYSQRLARRLNRLAKKYQRGMLISAC